jgi:hypothetical protein
MTLYEQMIASEEYKKLFDQLPNDRKYIIQEDMKKFMDDVENKLINPIKTHMETLTKK